MGQEEGGGGGLIFGWQDIYGGDMLFLISAILGFFSTVSYRVFCTGPSKRLCVLYISV